MAFTNNDSIITRGFMRGFFKRISKMFATKTEGIRGGEVAVVTDSSDKSSNDGAYIYGDTLYIKSNISVVKFNTTDCKSIGYIRFISDEDTVLNGARLDILGNWTIKIVSISTDYSICRGDYSHGYNTMSPYLTYDMSDSNTSGIMENETKAEFEPKGGTTYTSYPYTDLDKKFHTTHQSRVQLLFYDKRWFGSTPQVTLTTSDLSDNYGNDRIPVNSRAIYKLLRTNSSSNGNDVIFTSSYGESYYAINNAISYTHGIAQSALNSFNYYLPLSGGTLTGELQQSTGFIYTNGYINAKSYILTSGYFRGERIQLQPAAGSAPAYIDFFLPGSSVMSGRFINRVDKSIVLELSEYHSSNLLTFDSTTTEYTITKTDGYAGVVGAGTLTIPSISDDDAYTNKSLFGRRIFVDGNQGVITVNYASSCTDTDGNFLDQTIIVGRGQVAEFVLGHSNRWDLMNTDIPVIKKLSGTSYTLSLSDGVSIISGYGSVTLPIAAGWEGRKVVVCNKNPNVTGRNTFLSVTRQFVIAGTTYTPSATQFALTTSGEYTFTDGGWIKTGGVGMCAKRVTATGYTLTNTDDVTLITSTEANTITLPNTVGYRGRQLTITSYKGDVIVIFGYTSNTNKKITIPAYTSVIFVKSGDDRWSPQAGLTIESES